MSSQRRLARILGEDGRTVILALDAPAYGADVEIVDAAVASVPAMAARGLDAVLAPEGMAARNARAFRDVGVVLRCDVSTNPYDPTVPGAVIVGTGLDAVRLGCDGVVVMAFPGNDCHVDLQLATQKLRAECVAYGLPLIVEAVPFNLRGDQPRHIDPKNVQVAVRLAAELGADIVKTKYSGTPEDERIARTATVPVVALGGPKTDTRAYLEYVRHCVEMGAAGVAVGRNIVRDPAPIAKAAAIAAVVHDGLTGAAAADLYRDVAGSAAGL
jgi:DhnA family fructose-bisphosphate aldolase class Ia